MEDHLQPIKDLQTLSRALFPLSKTPMTTLTMITLELHCGHFALPPAFSGKSTNASCSNLSLRRCSSFSYMYDGSKCLSSLGFRCLILGLEVVVVFGSRYSGDGGSRCLGVGGGGCFGSRCGDDGCLRCRGYGLF